MSGDARGKADALFAQLALKLGLIDRKKLDAAISLQSRQNPPKPLGLLLLETRVLSPSDMDKILAAQKQLADQANERAKDARTDHLFGKVAIRLKFCTDEDLIECLDAQEQQPKEKRMRLGDLMIQRGVLTAGQVRRILDTQRGLILYCPSCDTEYNTVMFKPGASLQCYRCGSPMRIPVRGMDAPADLSTEDQ